MFSDNSIFIRLFDWPCFGGIMNSEIKRELKVFQLSDAGRIQCGFTPENKDCTVRAAALRFTTSYKRAHELLASVGRRDKRGVKADALYKLFDIMGLPFQSPIKPQNLSQFIKHHPAGRHYVVVRGHAVCVVNGVCVDTFPPKLRARVLFYA